MLYDYITCCPAYQTTYSYRPTSHSVKPVLPYGYAAPRKATLVDALSRSILRIRLGGMRVALPRSVLRGAGSRTRSCARRRLAALPPPPPRPRPPAASRARASCPPRHRPPPPPPPPPRRYLHPASAAGVHHAECVGIPLLLTCSATTDARACSVEETAFGSVRFGVSSLEYTQRG